MPVNGIYRPTSQLRLPRCAVYRLEALLERERDLERDRERERLREAGRRRRGLRERERVRLRRRRGGGDGRRMRGGGDRRRSGRYLKHAKMDSLNRRYLHHSNEGRGRGVGADTVKQILCGKLKI